MTMKISTKQLLTIALGTVLGSLTVHAISQPARSAQVATLLTSGLEGSVGSTVGPGGALYVTEGAAGRISRVDPVTGAVTTFAAGLPQTIPVIGLGGPVDVAFIGSTAYVLVTLGDRAPFEGPLSVRIGESDHQIGHALAAKILVESLGAQ